MNSKTRYSYRVDVVRNGVPIGSIKATAVTITFDSTLQVMRGMQAAVFPSSFKEYNHFSDMLRPVLIIGGKEYSFGDYMTISRSDSVITAENTSYDVEGYDITMRLQQCCFDSRRMFSAGTPYSNIIQALITECGITNVVMDPCDYTLQTDREVELGDTYIEFINELLNEIAYENVHIENDGYIHLNKKQVRSTADITYTDREKFAILKPVRVTEDVYKLPNVIVGVVSSPDYPEPITYKRVNDSLKSIISVPRRGYKVVKVNTYSNIASEEALHSLIDAEYINSMQATETLEIQTPCAGDHDYCSMVNIDTERVNGLYRETNWKIAFGSGGGNMVHTLEKKVFV